MKPGRPRYSKPNHDFLFKNAVLLLGFALSLVTLIWIAVVYDIEHEWEEHEENTVHDLDTLARALEGHARVTVDAIDASLLFLRQEYQNHPAGIDQAIGLVTRSVLDKAVVQIAMIGPDGMLARSNLGPIAAPVYLGDRAHFRVHRDSGKDRLYIGEPTFARVSRQWSLQFTRKLSNPDGSFAGVIVLSLVGTDQVVRAASSQQSESLGQKIADFRPLLPGAPVQLPQPARPSSRGRRGHFGERCLRSDAGSTGRILFRRGRGEPRHCRLRRPPAAQDPPPIPGRSTLSSHPAARVEGMIVCERSGIIREANQEACKMLGYTEDELVGHQLSVIEAAQPAANSPLIRPLSVDKAGSGREPMHRRKDGSRFPVELSISVTPGDEHLVFVLFRDITERKVQQERLWHRATFDDLTGLPNRALFHDRLGVAVAQVKRYGALAALMFVDLDHFKPVNDTLGHRVGDELLRNVASRLKVCVRDGDTLARLGGDEFCLILPNLRQEEECAAVACKILDTLHAPFFLAGRQVEISCSIGIAIFPDDGEEAAAVLEHADAAMYQAKRQGRNRYIRYSPELCCGAIAASG